MRLVFFLLMLVLASAAFAQKKKTKKREDASSVEPFYPQKDYAPRDKKKKNKKSGLTYTAQEKYYTRIDALEKNRRANERNGANPRYTDPEYFGHKRPPKKRPPGKMKFCKVCLIRH